MREDAIASPGRVASALATPARLDVAPSSSLTQRGPIRIERLILHALDNHRGSLRLVDEPVLLNDETARFFAQHVETAAQRADWHARFTEPENGVAALCQRLLGDPADFVDASQALARRLFAQMRPRTIAPGDFLAVTYRAGDDALQHVALLKLDPDRRLAREFTRFGGRTRVTITAAGNLLPDTARLQKCALLTTRVPGAGFDITLLDTQAGPRADGVAAFFYRGFLGAELAPSPRRRTREFLRGCDTWLAGRRAALAPVDVIAFYDARRAALCTATLDLAGFVASALPAHAHMRASLQAHLEETLSASADAWSAAGRGALEMDTHTAALITGRVTLELDGGARLSVPAERFAQMVRVDPLRTAENKYRLVIESLTLREVTER